MPAAGQRRRRVLLLVSLFSTLGILGFFKYFNFFVDSAATLLESLGLQPHLPILSIILPVGISFYTFQTMAYTIDVYRGKVEPTTDPILFGVYVAYFPQLVAGPIERAQNLLPQLSVARRATGQPISSGALLVLIGLVRKVAIADVAAPLVTRCLRTYPEPVGTQCGLLYCCSRSRSMETSPGTATWPAVSAGSLALS